MGRLSTTECTYLPTCLNQHLRPNLQAEPCLQLVCCAFNRKAAYNLSNKKSAGRAGHNNGLQTHRNLSQSLQCRRILKIYVDSIKIAMLDLLESKEEFQKIEAPQFNEDDRELPNHRNLLKPLKGICTPGSKGNVSAYQPHSEITY